MQILGVYTSYPYYHLAKTEKGTYYEAFALTWPGPSFSDTGWNNWSAVKQESVWRNPNLSHNIKAPTSVVAGAIADLLNDQAGCYQFFMNRINVAGGTMAPQDITETQNVKKINAGNEYIVGPFQMNYISGDFGIVFGGISDMYIVGEQTSRIEIDAFIINDERITPSYFKPAGTEEGQGHLTSPDVQQYPKPGEKFYVVYKATTDEQIDKIHVNFKWMEAECTKTTYEPTRYQSSITCNHEGHCHGHKGSHSASCYDIDAFRKQSTYVFK